MTPLIPLRILWRATPSAVKWLALGVMVLCVVYAVGYYAGGARGDLDDARNHIETREGLDNALDCSRDLAWSERLRACE